MNFSGKGDGDGFEVRFKVQWSTLNALCKAVLSIAISVIALWASFADHLHKLV